MTQATQVIERYLTAREVAAALGVKPATLYLWAHEGRGPRARRIGRELRWALSDLLAWLDELPPV